MKEIFALSPVMPVIALEREEDAIPLGEALLAGGIKVMEITLRTPAGLPSIARLRKSLPEMTVGAGTITTPEQFGAAKEAGAQFIVSPGASSRLFSVAKESSRLPFLPGAVTPSEIMAAREEGFTCLKFFPAVAAGGIAMLKSIEAVFPDVSFCPTGGIDAGNYRDFLALSNVACVGGTWLVAKPLLSARDWKAVTAHAKAIPKR
ncbi:MAG: eda [Rickettsiales bacterium]|jgi:2-dehydro-3-deoxyphosphogluconate aldolase/(4S)-4-hydroxy-2-oxoglutarate aldolase|nr:eda [Rickettsiales bacterium]